MEFTDPVRFVLDHKGSNIYSISPDDTVYRALEQLSQFGVGALIVTEGERIVGILSERDYARKIALQGRSSHSVPVREIMTEKVVVAAPEDTVEKCMRVITENRIRHLPVVENGKLLGVITVGDLIRWMNSRQNETIAQLTHYIEGGYVR